MVGIIEPMLAGKVDLKHLNDLHYPGLCTPKLDGIRCLIIKGKVVSRTLKPIPNKYIRDILETKTLNGMDGEIIVGNTFSEVTSGVMTRNGSPDFTYMVFDYVINPSEPYYLRMDRLKSLSVKNSHIKFVLPVKINNEEELLGFETTCIKEGYEGVIWRSPDSPYKFGRSTLKEEYLLKLKRFEDGEAEIIELYEEIDITGKPKNTLGGIKVRETKTGIRFHIGSGFDAEERKKIWNYKDNYVGKLVKYKSQPHGAKDAPRFPIFLGFRDKNDI